MEDDLVQDIPGLADFVTWDRLLTECDTLDGLSREDRAKVKIAVAALRRELGEDFLAEGWTARHDLPYFLLNRAPWTRKWLAWFGESLDHASARPNYASILTRLKHADQYAEAISVLEVYSRLVSADFEVGFDPVIMVSGVGKKPDLLAVNPATKEEVFVEVTGLRGSDATNEASDTARAISDLLIFHHTDLKFSGRIHKPLSRRHLEDVVEKVAAAVQDAGAKSDFRQISVPGVIDLGLSPPGAEAELASWASRQQLRVGHLLGPPFEFDEVRRVKNAIKNKRLQIPDGGTGVVVIQASGILYEGKTIPTLLSELEEGVYDYPKILAAVVIAGWIGEGQNGILRHNEHAVVQIVRHDIRIENAFFVYNRYYANGVSDKTIDMVRRAFGVS